MLHLLAWDWYFATDEVVEESRLAAAVDVTTISTRRRLFVAASRIPFKRCRVEWLKATASPAKGWASYQLFSLSLPPANAIFGQACFLTPEATTATLFDMANINLPGLLPRSWTRAEWQMEFQLFLIRKHKDMVWKGKKGNWK